MDDRDQSSTLLSVRVDDNGRLLKSYLPNSTILVSLKVLTILHRALQDVQSVVEQARRAGTVCDDRSHWRHDVASPPANPRLHPAGSAELVQV